MYEKAYAAGEIDFDTGLKKDGTEVFPGQLDLEPEPILPENMLSMGPPFGVE